MAKLVLRITGPDGARRGVSEHDPDGVIIGSGPAAAVRLEDPKISALHCLIKLDRGSLTVIDLGSESGTRVGGRAILGPTVLETGALVELGESRLEVFDGAEEIGALSRAPVPDLAPASRSRPPPVASALLPESAARRAQGAGKVLWASLLREDPPPQEAPLAQARQLEAALFWGDVLLDVRHFDAGRVALGSVGHCDFQDMGAREGPLLAMLSREGCTLALPVSADVTLRRGGLQKSSQDLTREGALASGPDSQSRSLSMQLHDRVHVGLSGLGLVLRFVRPQGLPQGGPARFDWTFVTIVATAALTWIALLAAILWAAPLAERPEALFREPQRWAKYIIKPPRPMRRGRSPRPRKGPRARPRRPRSPGPPRAGSSPVAGKAPRATSTAAGR